MAQGTGNTGVAEATNGATSTKSRPNRSYIVVPLPPELKARFEAEAKAADQPVGPYVLRNVIAKQLGIDIPIAVTARRSKYSSDDERKAAQTARAKSRSQTMKSLMQAFRQLQQSGISAEEAARQASLTVLAGGTEAEAAPAPA